ncbi:MAG: S24 family peptidase [Nocardioides sp.]
MRRPLIGRWGIARVRGESMRPTCEPGDRLVVEYGARVGAGDLVIARFPDSTLVVKRAAEPRPRPDGAGGWWLLSDNPRAGTDSRHVGAIADQDVIARVRARAWPRPRSAAALRRSGLR